MQRVARGDTLQAHENWLLRPEAAVLWLLTREGQAETALSDAEQDTHEWGCGENCPDEVESFLDQRLY